MTAAELVDGCNRDPATAQLLVSSFIDDLRRAAPSERAALVASGPKANGRWEGLVAAVVSSLAREGGFEAPAWVAHVTSVEPFFAYPARGFALRLRLMVESPPPFRCRNVFVPADYMARA
jgi:hypothetical protein